MTVGERELYVCPRCGGRGYLPWYGNVPSCSACNGTGYMGPKTMEKCQQEDFERAVRYRRAERENTAREAAELVRRTQNSPE